MVLPEIVSLSLNPFSWFNSPLDVFFRSKATTIQKVPVLIVGAGISGLSCAKILSETTSPLILEQSDRVGGRIQTDDVDGYLLDRGFQIFIDSYPFVSDSRIINKAALDLCKFRPGALIRVGRKFHLVSDPLRRPTDLLETLVSPVGTFLDKLKVGKKPFACIMFTCKASV